MRWLKWLEWFRDPVYVPSDVDLRPGPNSKAEQQVIRLDCGHLSSSYATYPQTGATACLDCYHQHLLATKG